MSFTSTIKVRAVLLAAENGDWVLFGTNDADDKENYDALVPDHWVEDPIDQATVIVEFEIKVSNRPIALARLPKMEVSQPEARAAGGPVTATPMERP